MFRRLIVVATLGVTCALPIVAQPLTLNTTLRSFTPVAGNPWIAGCFGYQNASGDFALICQGNTGLDIWDITNPAAPVLATHINATGSDLKEVKVFQNYCYCVQQSGPVLVVNLTNPYAATVVSSFSGSGHTAYITGGFLYFSREGGGSFDGLEMWDLNTSPTAPALAGTYDPGSFCAHDTFVDGNTAYVSAPFGSNIGTHIVDITNKASPIFRSVIQHGSIPHSSYIYTAPGGKKVLCCCNEGSGGYARFFDVSNPLSPVEIGSYQSSTSTIVHNPWVVGRYLYLAYYQDYLRIIDLANPHVPVEVGVYDPDPLNTGGVVFGAYGGAWGVYPITPTRIIMTESFIAPTGFYVVDWTPPTAINLGITQPAPGSLTLSENGASPNGFIINAISADVTQLFGYGPFFGLGADAVNTIGFTPVTNPFSVFADASGNYNFSIAGLPVGVSFDLRGGTSIAGQVRLTQLARITL